MHVHVHHRRMGLLLMLALIATVLVPVPARAQVPVPVVVATHGNASNAVAGESGGEIPESALITVLVTRHVNGTPVTDLGASIPHDSDGIALPAGVVLFSNPNVPPGGCLMSPTELTNWGNGVYTIRVAAFLGNPACVWLDGDYHYAIHLNAVRGFVRYQGSGLGVLKIPEAPAAPAAR